MTKSKTKKKILLIISLIFLAVFACFGLRWLWRVMEPEREQQKRIDKSIREAHEIEREQFCTRYMEYTEPQEAPYAYRYCWNYKD